MDGDFPPRWTPEPRRRKRGFKRRLIRHLARFFSHISIGLMVIGCSASNGNLVHRSGSSVIDQAVVGTDCAARVKAIRKLGNPGQLPVSEREQALRQLCNLSRHEPNAVLRCATAEALGGYADAEAIECLVSGLRDQSPLVRGESAKALGRIQAPSAVESLTVLATTDSDVDAREAATTALAAYNTRETNIILTQCLKDHEILVSQAALRGLRKNTGVQNIDDDPRDWLAHLDQNRGEQTGGSQIQTVGALESKP